MNEYLFISKIFYLSSALQSNFIHEFPKPIKYSGCCFIRYFVIVNSILIFFCIWIEMK